MTQVFRSGAWMFAAAVALAAMPAMAQLARRAPVPAGGGAAAGNVNLPYTVQDNMGNQWRIYQYGQLQQSGNMPLYSQGAMLMVNGNQAMVQNNRGRMDEKTGELVLEGMQVQNGITITRRILINKESNLVRYVDVFKNTSGQDQSINVMVQTSMNYGVGSAQLIEDPKKKGTQIGWVAQTGPNNNGTVVEVFSGHKSKNPMTIQYQPGNSVVQGQMQLVVPAKKDVAIAHLHGMFASQEAGAKFVREFKDSQILKDVPREIRKILVNFSSSQGFVGELEVLRGDLLDVVELKSGDQLKGTLKANSYELTTFYGPVSLPVDRVIALANVGQFRTRQLVVTVDGQVYGGELKEPNIELQLSSGQVTSIPLSQVARVGYRKREGEPEEWTFEKPIVLMRSGERIGVKLPAEPVEVATRYGRLALKPEQIAAVVLENEDSGVHQIQLTDGSRFSGLLVAGAFKMTLDTTGPEQVVTFPVSAMSRLQFVGKEIEIDDAASTLALQNDDVLIGTVQGKLKMDTAFDTIVINAGEIKSLGHLEASAVDVQVALWDGSTLSGQLQDLDLAVTLGAGVQMRVPVALIEQYDQPQPQPSDDMKEKIRKVIADLNAEDWKQRDRAQAALTSMGPVAIPVIRELMDGQPPEAQERMKKIVEDLLKQRDGK